MNIVQSLNSSCSNNLTIIQLHEKISKVNPVKAPHQCDENLGRLHQTDQKTMKQKTVQHHLEDLKQIHSEKTARKTLLRLKVKIGMLKRIKSKSVNQHLMI